MSLLAPLGLLGLIGVIILIIIYIIKPNYQSKFISSTFIWKLSLKYRKKKIPLSKLRNIILFICQVLILTAAAFVLAQPIWEEQKEETAGEVVMIIDASASMQASIGGETRFERAALRAMEDANDALNEGKKVSLIIAADKASFILQQVGIESRELIVEAFNNIIDNPEKMWTYSTSDIKGAMTLAEEITNGTEDVSVTLYTDTTYLNKGEVEVEDMKDPAEWNAAILDVRATIVENYYRIEIDVACYGADALVSVNCDIYDFNNTNTVLELQNDVYCSGDETVTLVYGFVSEDMAEVEAELITEEISVYEYDRIHVYISENDSMETDNQFYLYGGHKPVLKVLYYSTLPNNYFTTALLIIQDSLKEDWAIEITEVTKDPPTSGYDLYIYEHDAPATVPIDGVVIYANASNIPTTAGIRYDRVIASQEELFLEPGESHPIMDLVNPANISVTQFMTIASYDGYIPLLTLQGLPVVMLKEDVDQNILLLPFSLHYSNLPLTVEYPIILCNLINYFFPVMIDGFVYEVNDTVSVDAKTDLIDVSGPNTELELTTFPAEWVVTEPGTYTVMQNPMSGNPRIENVFVKIPAEESNTNLTVDVLENPYFFTEDYTDILDLLFYLALGMVALLFFEWWLKSRE